MKRAVQRKNRKRPCVTYLTTQEVADLLGCHKDTVINRVSRGYVEPAARAGKFARAMCFWTEDQLPEIRRAVIEHAHVPCGGRVFVVPGKGV